MGDTIYGHRVETLSGEQTDLSEHRGKVMLIVNTASKCGFTPQYEGLEALYERYRDRGFVVLGFPCNQFAKQEPGTADEIASFCEKNYGVTFPMYAKIDVNGAHTHPLYEELKSAAKGVLGSKAIKWNFTKFLVDRKGDVVERFGSNVDPAALDQPIERLL
ncbi:MAG: glutathione peroxidase [Myxococcales bacterium]|nr:glutathione peroxidase [Myxococcales bacterium]